MTKEEKAKAYDEAIKKAKEIKEKIVYSRLSTESCKAVSEYIDIIIPELKESEDERIRKVIHKLLLGMRKEIFTSQDDIVTKDKALAYLEKQKERGPLTKDEEYTLHRIIEYLEDETCPSEWISLLHDIYCLPYEKQKEQKPIIQDVELNDAVYDYVRDHFIAGADFTPEYIKKLMENAFFAGVDYYLLKQESESCESDTNVEKVIEDVIRVYGKTQGEWVGGYDVDTLIVNLRRAFNKKEQKPVEPSDEELQRHQDELYDFKVFATKQAKEHHISFVHDFEWNNFCAEILSYFNEQKYTPKFKVGDKLMSNGNHLLTYKILEVGHINELGNPEYKVEIFTDGKLDEPHNIHYMECRRVDEWGKLKEQKPVEVKDPFSNANFVRGYESGYADAKREQKPAEWSEEDENMLNRIIETLSLPPIYDTKACAKMVSWLKSLRPQPKQEWSEDWQEEDIQTRFAFYTYKDDPSVLYLSNVFVEELSRNHGFGTRILRAAEKVAETIGATTIRLKVKQDSPANAWYRKNGYGYVAFEDGYDWLEKNLEYMKPFKQEWSEEDDKLLNYAISMTDDAQVKNFLESLRPSWKPSEEQMNRLLSIIAALRKDYCDDMADFLASIYHNLEKLI